MKGKILLVTLLLGGFAFSATVQEFKPQVGFSRSWL